ncbi:MAG: cytochrome b/b6 domain-containing protein [Phycisphaerales bacterium JB039]
MARVLIWDLPTRLFHWLFAGGFLAAALIALALDEDGPLFPFHAIIGLTLAIMIVLRVVWGLAGSRYARFGSFLFGPRSVAEYVIGVVTGAGRRHIGHNPGSAYAILAMLAMTLALAVTGIMMAQGAEDLKEVHEVLAWAMLAVIGAHVLGVVVYTIRRRENITASMIHGRKTAEEAAGIRSTHPVAAAAFLLLSGAWAAALLANYDAASQSTVVPLLGTLQIGEAEHDVEGSRRRGHEERDHDDDDD